MDANVGRNELHSQSKTQQRRMQITALRRLNSLLTGLIAWEGRAALPKDSEMAAGGAPRIVVEPQLAEVPGCISIATSVWSTAELSQATPTATCAGAGNPQKPDIVLSVSLSTIAAEKWIGCAPRALDAQHPFAPSDFKGAAGGTIVPLDGKAGKGLLPPHLEDGAILSREYCSSCPTPDDKVEVSSLPLLTY